MLPRTNQAFLGRSLPGSAPLYGPVAHRDYDLQAKHYAAASGAQATNPYPRIVHTRRGTGDEGMRHSVGHRPGEEHDIV